MTAKELLAEIIGVYNNPPNPKYLMTHLEDIVRNYRKNEIEKFEKKWISVKEKMPENRQVVIIYWDYQGVKKITSGSYNENGDYWQHGAATQLKVTHWMPLPEPPKKTN